MITYFSGTGNSRFAARQLARLLDDTAFPLSPPVKGVPPMPLPGDTPLVVACPTYAWRIPRLVEEMLAHCALGGSRQAYFVLTCGSDIGNAAHYTEALCHTLGWQHMGTAELVMPENYVAMFPVPDEEEATRIVKKALPVLEALAACIRARTPFPQKRISLPDRMKSGFINEGFYRHFIKDKGFYATDACTACNHCVRVCPLQNIALVQGKPHWHGNCTHCMACICSCPQEAIEYKKRSLGKRRYRCPHVEGL